MEILKRIHVNLHHAGIANRILKPQKIQYFEYLTIRLRA